MKNNNVTEKDLFYILDLFEHMKVTYWLDGGFFGSSYNSKKFTFLNKNNGLIYLKKKVIFTVKLMKIILLYMN